MRRITIPLLLELQPPCHSKTADEVEDFCFLVCSAPPNHYILYDIVVYYLNQRIYIVLHVLIEQQSNTVP